MTDILFEIDVWLFRLLNQWVANSVLDDVMPFITEFNNFKLPLVIAGILALVFGRPRFRWIVVLALLSVILADMIGQDLKVTFQRPRPFWTLEDVRFPDSPSSSTSFSFPSNHAVNSFAGLSMLAWYFRRRLYLAIPLLCFAGMVAWSRVYVGVHYPSDVFMGALLGLGTTTGLLLLDRFFPVVRWKDGRTDGFSWAGLSALMLGCLGLLRYSFFLRGEIPVTPDELRLWDWSAHLALSYEGHAPLVVWLTGLGTMLFGHTAFGIRFFAGTLGLGVSAVAFLFGRHILNSERAAFLALTGASVVPLFAFAAIRMTPVIPLLFFAAVFLYGFARGAFAGDRRGYIAAAAAMLFGSLASPAALLPLAGAIIGVCSVPALRNRGCVAGLALSAAGAAVGILPMITAVRGGHALGGWQTSATVDGSGVGLMVLLFLFSPILLGYIAWTIGQNYVAWHSSGEGRRLLLLASILPSVAFLPLVLFAGWSIDWIATAGLPLVLLASAELDDWHRRAATWSDRYMPPVVAFAIFACSVVPLVPAIHGDVFRSLAQSFPKGEKLVPPAIDPGFRMQGYRRVGERVNEFIAEMPDPERVFIAAYHWQEALYFSFYTRDIPVLYLGETGWTSLGGRAAVHTEEYIGWDAIAVIGWDEGELEYSAEKVSVFHEYHEPFLHEEARKRDVYRRFLVQRLYGYQGRAALPGHDSDGHPAPGS